MLLSSLEETPLYAERALVTKLEHIEKTVAELAPDDFEAFAEWFEALQASRWDEQFESDAQAGKLDQLANKALADFRAGKTTAL